MPPSPSQSVSGSGAAGARPHISVIIPALNEEETIADVVRGIPPALVDEVIVVDNGSTDATAERARQAGAKVIAEHRRGYGGACCAGVLATPQSGILVFLDGDGSDCPELMNRLLEPILADTHDFVIGSRLRGRRETDSMNLAQVWAGRIAGVLLNLVYGITYTDMCPFRGLGRLSRVQKVHRSFRKLSQIAVCGIIPSGWRLQSKTKRLREGLREPLFGPVKMVTQAGRGSSAKRAARSCATGLNI